MNRGFLKLFRKIQENDIWLIKPFSPGQAWVDLLLLANIKVSTFFKRGVEIVVERGQVGMSEKGLADRWGWSRTKTRQYLSRLETRHQIKHQKSNVTSLITIVNYDEYNEKDTKKDSRKTPEEHQKDTSKEDKEVKNKHYGEFANVMLTDDEYAKLQNKFNGSCQEKIETLSAYMKSKGKRYKSHYATILNWARKDSASEPKISRGQEL